MYKAHSWIQTDLVINRSSLDRMPCLESLGNVEDWTEVRFYYCVLKFDAYKSLFPSTVLSPAISLADLSIGEVHFWMLSFEPVDCL